MDKDIDMKAKGFYGCILSLPDTQTHLSIKEMMELVGQGEVVVRNAIKELIKFGYCVRNYAYSPKRTGVEYVFYEKSLLSLNSENINLENINLENINLENINLENINLENINLENHNLVISKKKGKSKSDAVFFQETKYFDPNFKEHDPTTYNSKPFQLFCDELKDYAKFDLPIYYAKVRDWSVQKEANKRKDWIAVARQFINGDKNPVLAKINANTIFTQPPTKSKYEETDPTKFLRK